MSAPIKRDSNGLIWIENVAGLLERTTGASISDLDISPDKNPNHHDEKMWWSHLTIGMTSVNNVNARLWFLGLRYDGFIYTQHVVQIRYCDVKCVKSNEKANAICLTCWKESCWWRCVVPKVWCEKNSLF